MTLSPVYTSKNGAKGYATKLVQRKKCRASVFRYIVTKRDSSLFRKPIFPSRNNGEERNTAGANVVIYRSASAEMRMRAIHLNVYERNAEFRTGTLSRRTSPWSRTHVSFRNATIVAFACVPIGKRDRLAQSPPRDFKTLEEKFFSLASSRALRFSPSRDALTRRTNNNVRGP